MPPKRSTGRPPLMPTDEQRTLVRELSGMGMPRENIAKVIKNKKGKGISIDTLVHHFKDELADGIAQMNLTVAKSLFAIATNPNGGAPAVTACIFWLKTRARWRQNDSEYDPNENPIRHDPDADIDG